MRVILVRRGLSVKRFTILSVPSVLPLLHQGIWLVILDLLDTYFHSKIRTYHHKYRCGSHIPNTLSFCYDTHDLYQGGSDSTSIPKGNEDARYILNLNVALTVTVVHQATTSIVPLFVLFP